MSEESDHGATRIQASNSGGWKWLLGAAAAVVLIGGGYFAWKNLAPGQDNAQTAYNDPYSADSRRVGPSDQDTIAQSANIAPPASTETRTAAPARRSAVRAAAVPEVTIGITPVNATTEYSDSDEIVVTAPRRPLWAHTPSERRLSALYPARALQRGREGEARLYCTVQDGGALDCVRVSETPGGFGNAALRVARTFRHVSQLADGSDATGTPLNLRVVFRMEDDERRG